MTVAYHKFYINGEWTHPGERSRLDVINPANEEAFASISLGTTADVDAAVDAARGAFPAWSKSSIEERIAVIEAIVAGMLARREDLAEAISMEMGAPMTLASMGQFGSGMNHFKTILGILADYKFEEHRGATRIVREAAGVCGFITPWNWPLNQIGCKVAPALAAG